MHSSLTIRCGISLVIVVRFVLLQENENENQYLHANLISSCCCYSGCCAILRLPCFSLHLHHLVVLCFIYSLYCNCISKEVFFSPHKPHMLAETHTSHRTRTLQSPSDPNDTYVHSYSFHKSTQSNGSGQIMFEQGRFEGQLRSKFRAIVACPHWVPFMEGGNGKCLPSSLEEYQKKKREGEKWKKKKEH